MWRTIDCTECGKIFKSSNLVRPLLVTRSPNRKKVAFVKSVLRAPGNFQDTKYLTGNQIWLVAISATNYAAERITCYNIKKGNTKTKHTNKYVSLSLIIHDTDKIFSLSTFFVKIYWHLKIFL